jgi:urease accessory protein
LTLINPRNAMPVSLRSSSQSPAQSPSLAEVGRVGNLMLRYDRQDHTTILSDSRSNSPWHLFPPMHLGDAAYTLLVNPSGGLVGGDRLTLQAHLGCRTHVLISTPSANRVYRSLGSVAAQEIDVFLGAHSILEWVPEVTIPFAGSRYSQRIAAVLETGAVLLLWDGLAAGRIARGERWAFASFQNEIRIKTSSGGLLMERYHLQAERDQDEARVPRCMVEWDYVGSLFIIGDQVKPETWKAVETSLAEGLERWPGRVLAGVSEPAMGGRVVKILARTAPDLQMALNTAWAGVRKLLWNSPLPDLRRY